MQLQLQHGKLQLPLLWQLLQLLPLLLFCGTSIVSIQIISEMLHNHPKRFIPTPLVTPVSSYRCKVRALKRLP